MNNKEFINTLAARLDISAKEAQSLSTALIDEIANKLDEGETLAIQSFGNFEVKKKMERVVVNPTTKQRLLVPPKLVIAFKPSSVLKDKHK